MIDTTVGGLTIHDYGRQVSPDETTARARLEEAYPGAVWDTAELQTAFEVIGFAAPFVVAVRRSDGKRGSIEFTHSPRLYFNFIAD